MVSAVLANVYLHKVLDQGHEEVVKAHCRGAAYFCRYADDFVAAFQYEADARRFYAALGKRLGKYGLSLAEDKTRLLGLSRNPRRNREAFEFLGFEFRWGLSRRRRPILKRRTASGKYRAALANFTVWCCHNRRLPRRELLERMAAKLRGCCQYYGIRGNYRRLWNFFHQAKRILFKTLNRRSQRQSHDWTGFAGLLEHFQLPLPRICHAF